MDNNNKKQQFSRSASKAFQSSDSNRKTDLQANKPFVRNTRRREQSQPSRNEQSRNNKQPTAPTQRQRLDKRPRPRGGYAPSSINNSASRSQANAINGDNGGSFDDFTCEDEDIDVTGTGLVIGKAGRGGTNAAARRFNDQMHELNSVYAPGSKKQNLNHLLNFHFPSRDVNTASFNPFGRHGTSSYHHRYYQNAGGVVLFKKPRYSKEQYLQANFQFVISTKTNFVVYSPDALIAWDQIEQINMHTTEEPKCPICLYPLSAAKITRCGHVYCWVCMIHYLAINQEEKICTCPLCHEGVQVNDLKSVHILPQRAYNEGDQITFQLMRRKKGSLLIEKHTKQAHQSDITGYPMYSSNDQMKLFSKFILANENDILSIIDREERELMSSACDDTGIDVFTSMALAKLKERRQKVAANEKCIISDTQTERSSMEKTQQPSDHDDNHDGDGDGDADGGVKTGGGDVDCEKFTKIINGQQQEMHVELEHGEGAPDNLMLATLEENCEIADIDFNDSDHQLHHLPDELTIPEGDEAETAADDHANDENFDPMSTGNPYGSKYYYFYQSQDGQNIYLHPLNIKMLQVNYGTLDLAPMLITSRIKQKESYSMDEEYRRKFTCLSHLPLNCQFGVYEVDLRPPIITHEVRDLFKDDLVLRKKKREQRKRDEMRHEKKINEMNDREYGRFVEATRQLNLNSNSDFPEFGFEEYLPAIAHPADTQMAATNDSNAPKSSYSQVAVHNESPVEDFPAWPDTIVNAKRQAGKQTNNKIEINGQCNAGGSGLKADQSGDDAPTWSNIASNLKASKMQAATQTKLPNKPNANPASFTTAELQKMRESIVDSEGMISELRSTNLGDVLAEAISQKRHSGGETAPANVDIGSGKKSKKNKKMMPLFSTGINYNGNM